MAKVERYGPRILVSSNFNDGMTLYNGLCFEFCSIIQATGNADLCAPKARRPVPGLDPIRSLWSKARRASGLARLPHLQRETVGSDYDLFFYMCMNPRDLAELRSIRGWRDRCRLAVAFVFESWSSQLERDKAHLQLLDDFDHVFIYNRSSIQTVRRYTSAPCSFLAAGADCLSATPYPDPPHRWIDVYSMGRRLDSTHRQLVEMASRNELAYLFDGGSGLRVYDFAQSRLLTHSLIKRSRYFMAYSLDAGPKATESAGEQALATRLFEGAAGGAVVLGTPPKASEFGELFDWTDAVVDIPVEPDDMRAILRDLDAQPERMSRARRMNAMQSLRKHDWVHRFEHILTTLGFDPTPGVLERKARLRDLADRVEQRHDNESRSSSFIRGETR
jgi:hypothetical protein